MLLIPRSITVSWSTEYVGDIQMLLEHPVACTNEGLAFMACHCEVPIFSPPLFLPIPPVLHRTEWKWRRRKRESLVTMKIRYPFSRQLFGSLFSIKTWLTMPKREAEKKAGKKPSSERNKVFHTKGAQDALKHKLLLKSLLFVGEQQEYSGTRHSRCSHGISTKPQVLEDSLKDWWSVDISYHLRRMRMSNIPKCSIWEASTLHYLNGISYPQEILSISWANL